MCNLCHYKSVVHFLSHSLKRSRYSRHNSINATMNMSTGHVKRSGEEKSKVKDSARARTHTQETEE